MSHVRVKEGRRFSILTLSFIVVTLCVLAAMAVPQFSAYRSRSSSPLMGTFDYDYAAPARINMSSPWSMEQREVMKWVIARNSSVWSGHAPCSIDRNLQGRSCIMAFQMLFSLTLWVH